jgi:hypothetical protein
MAALPDLTKAALRLIYDRWQVEDGEFRLLIVDSISVTGIPVCSFVKARFGDRHDEALVLFEGEWVEGPYMAVSYKWGGQPFDHNIHLFGLLMVKVTRSCFDVIRALKKHDFRVIWIDQLCIDQDPDKMDERSRQIMLMNRIYSCAKVVVVWLDRWENVASPNQAGVYTERAIESIPTVQSTGSSLIPDTTVHDVIQHEFQETRNLIQYLSDYWSEGMGSAKRGHSNSSVDIAPLAAAWDSVLAIFDHSYFERRWIIQEITNPKSTVALLLGDQFLGLELMSNCASQIKLIRWGFSTEFNDSIPASAMERLRAHTNPTTCLFDIIGIGRDRKAGTTIHLLSLLTRCRHFQTTDTLDRIYALQSMAADASLPAPNYQLTVEELLIRLARYFIMQGQGSAIIEQTGLACRSQESCVPSWCPTWEATYTRPYNNGLTQERSGFLAAGSTVPQMTVVGDGTLLRVRGAIIDTVQAVTPPVEPEELDDLNPEAVTIIRRLLPEKRLTDAEFDELVAPFNESQTNDERIERLSKPMCFNIERLLSKLFVANHRLLTAEGASETSRLTRNMNTDLDSSRWYRGRRFCATENRRVGLVPEEARAGDLICVIAGVNVTMILRVNASRSDTYQVVGDSYIMGLGRGEAMALDYYANVRDLILS